MSRLPEPRPRGSAPRADLRAAAATLAALASLLAGADPSDASVFKNLHGSMGVGYAKLFIDDAPAGNFSAAAGVDYPVRGNWRAGVGIGLHLLGNRTEERGSQVASVDYSLFEAGLFAHWSPPGLGPIGRISFGPELMSARAELSTSGGGVAFQDLAVEETAAGVGVDVTLISRSSSPVRVGFETGLRVAFLDVDEWTIATARLVFHY